MSGYTQPRKWIGTILYQYRNLSKQSVRWNGKSKTSGAAKLRKKCSSVHSYYLYLELTRGLPKLLGLIFASVWIISGWGYRPSVPVSDINLPGCLIRPLVKQFANPYGFPIANTCSPILWTEQLPNCTGKRGSVWFSVIFKTAISFTWFIPSTTA